MVRVRWALIIMVMTTASALGASDEDESPEARERRGRFRDSFTLEQLGLADYSDRPDWGPTKFVYRIDHAVTHHVGPRRTFDRLRELIVASRSKYKGVRGHAVEELVGVKSLRAAKAVAGRLGDPDIGVRERAAWGLGEMGFRGAVRPLIDALSENGPPISDTIARSLKRLTGLDYGSNYGRWSAWYDAIHRAR